MLRLAVPQSIEGFFANAGQAAVERALVQTLPATGRVHLRILALGNRDSQAQLADYCAPQLRESVVSIVPFHTGMRTDVLTGLDGVILHGLSPEASLRTWLRQSRLTRRLPVVQHIHSLFLAEFEFSMYNELWDGWQGWPPATWVAPTECCARRARLLRQPASMCPPVVVIPHGVLRDEVGAGNRARGRQFLGAQNDDLVMLSLARLSEEKCDYRTLVRALHALRQAAPVGARVLLALVGGQGPDDDVYIDHLRGLIAALDLRRRVRIIDNLDDDKKADVLAAADLFVSLACNPQESFGIALLEAQVAGLPIVATEWNGYPEVLPPFYRGRMVSTVASAAYARTLNWRHLSDAGAIEFTSLVALLRQFLESSDLRADAAREGREHARGFTWRRTAEGLADVWEELAARHRAGPDGPARVVRDDGPRQRPSPVDGLATYYTEPAFRFRVASEVPTSLADERVPPPLRELLAAHVGDVLTVAQWRDAYGLAVESSDRLFLRCIRAGSVSAAPT